MGVKDVVLGQNENPDSPHYGDQRDLAAWWFFKPMLTERPDIEKR